MITGGQVGNEDQIAETFAPRVRVHAIGMGATVNTGLLRRLAAVGRGEMLLAETEDALDDLAPSLRRLLGPALLTDLNLAGDEFSCSPIRSRQAAHPISSPAARW